MNGLVCIHPINHMVIIPAHFFFRLLVICVRPCFPASKLFFAFKITLCQNNLICRTGIPSSPHVGLWVGTTQCRSASDSLQKGAELFFPAPNRLFFFHLLFISPMNMLFRGVAPHYIIWRIAENGLISSKKA